MSKKLIIPKESFGGMSIYSPEYQVRFRLISEDRNRYSAWTPIFSVDPTVVFERGTREYPGVMVVEKHTGYVNLTWDAVSIYKDNDGALSYLTELPYYDLWIRWAGSGGINPSPWLYKERISSTSVNLNVPTSYIDESGVTRSAPKYMYAEIYRPGVPILRYEQTYPFPQNSSTVDTTNDYINFGRNHGSSTGTPGLYLSATPISGLTNNTVYYTRTINYTTIALYPTRADALANTNKINLNGTPSGTGSFTGFPFRMYDGVITTL